MFRVRVTQPAPEAEKVPENTRSLEVTSTMSVLLSKWSLLTFFIYTSMLPKEKAAVEVYSKLMAVMVPPLDILISAAV